MSSVHRRAARREEQLAGVLESRRVKNRPRYQKAPDVVPLMLPSGLVIQPESKSKTRLPRWLLDAIEQAAGYTPGAIPLVALFELGSRDGLAVVRLRDLPRLLGIKDPEPGEQLPLVGGR